MAKLPQISVQFPAGSGAFVVPNDSLGKIVSKDQNKKLLSAGEFVDIPGAIQGQNKTTPPTTTYSLETAVTLLAGEGVVGPQATELVRQTREFVKQAGLNPVSGFGKIVQAHKVTLLGEAHDYNGRYLTLPLIKKAVEKGVNVLFLEAGPEHQAQINRFALTGDLRTLPVFLGGMTVHGSQYAQTLLYAQRHGVKLVAVDMAKSLMEGAQARNEFMASSIHNYMVAHPKAKGVFIVGQLHMMDAGRKSIPVQTFLGQLGLKTGQVFRESFDDVRTSKHPIPFARDTGAAVVLEVNGYRPVMLPTKGSPLEQLNGKHPGSLGPYTQVIYYPYQKWPAL